MKDHQEREAEPRWSPGLILQRLVIIVFALGLTAVVFYFWGVVGNAMHIYLSAPTAPAANNSGEVTVMVLPAKPGNAPAQKQPAQKQPAPNRPTQDQNSPQMRDCTREHPCR